MEQTPPNNKEQFGLRLGPKKVRTIMPQNVQNVNRMGTGFRDAFDAVATRTISQADHRFKNTRASERRG